MAAIELGYGGFDTALKRFDDVLVTRPNDADVLMSRGVALRGLEKYDEAQKAYEAALRARPASPEPEYNLCVMHQQYTLKYDIAKTRCEAYLGRIDRSSPKFGEVTKRVKSIEAVMKKLGGSKTP
jgi:tetratricopeptide (TPR) repeat protein